MPVANSDLVEYLSASAGSTGGAITGSSVTSGVPNNVNPNKDDTARLAGGTDYRKTFWKNINGTDAAQVPIIFAKVLPTNITLSFGLGIDHTSDDDPAQGNMTAWGAAAKVALVSSSAGDTRIVTIVGLDNTGTPVPVTETVALNGTTEVLSANTYTKVLRVTVASTDGARTVTVKQGSGGATRGTIAPNKIICFLWVSSPGTAKSAGLSLPNLAPSQSYGLWRRLAWSAGAGAVRPDSQTVRIEEGQ